MVQAGRLSEMEPNQILPTDGESQMINEIARANFAKANGWRYTSRSFTLDALIRGLYSGGESDQRFLTQLAIKHGRAHHHAYGSPLAFDHRESFRLPKSEGGRPVAIMGHNYGGADGPDGRSLRWLIDDLAGELVLHVPPTGEAASWYYPGATLPMCVTRPGTEVAWPTFEEMAEFAATYQRARERQHPEAGTWVPDPQPWD